MNERKETEAIRSDIDVTRRRMDETMDALGDRLKGRHLVDELLGFFRRSDGDSEGARHKIARSTSAAVHSVMDTVKANPIPSLLIGAGVAWMIYNARKEPGTEEYGREMGEDFDYTLGARMRRESRRYDPDTHLDRPLEYPATESGMQTGFGSSVGGVADNLREKASSAKEQVKEKLGEFGETAKEKISAMGEKAGELGSRAQESAREAKERLSNTADRHPLELGLGCLALGLIAGLAIPTPQRIKRMAGPTVDRLKNRTREAGAEMMEKGKRVVRAAKTAAEEEAEAQGLTSESGNKMRGGKRGETGTTDPLSAGPMTTATGDASASGSQGTTPPPTARPM